MPATRKSVPAHGIAMDSPTHPGVAKRAVRERSKPSGWVVTIRRSEPVSSKDPTRFLLPQRWDQMDRTCLAAQCTLVQIHSGGTMAAKLERLKRWYDDPIMFDGDLTNQPPWQH
jgi:hypothetical protein